MKRLVSLATTLGLFAMPAQAFEPDAATRAALERASGPNGFSGVVMVDTGDGAPWTYVTGMATLSPELEVSAETRFDIGSVGKIMTATAMMQLVEAGRVSLAAPISTYLPEFPAGPGGKVTVAMLLDHTAGLDEIVFNPDFMDQMHDARNNHDIYEVIARQPHADAANGRRAYSNTAYVVAAEVIERVSGQTWEAYMQAHVFEPAGMTGVAFSAKDTPLAAAGYTNGQHEGRRTPGPVTPSETPYNQPTGFMDDQIASGAGGLYARAADLTAFARALMGDRLISADGLTQMCTPRPGGVPGAQFGSGLGCVTLNFGGVTTIGHNGGRPGMNADLAIARGKGAVVVALSNHDRRAEPMSHTLRATLAALPDR